MKRGDLWLVRLDKARPAIVLTRDPIADRLNAVLVVAVTRTVRGLPVEVPLGAADGVLSASVANLDQAQRVTKANFVRRLGKVRLSTMEAICEAMHYAIGC